MQRAEEREWFAAEFEALPSVAFSREEQTSFAKLLLTSQVQAFRVGCEEHEDGPEL